MTQKATVIKQKYYEDLGIIFDEKDVIQIWMNGKEDSNVILIERDKIQSLIDILIMANSPQLKTSSNDTRRKRI